MALFKTKENSLDQINTGETGEARRPGRVQRAAILGAGLLTAAVVGDRIIELRDSGNFTGVKHSQEPGSGTHTYSGSFAEGEPDLIQNDPRDMQVETVGDGESLWTINRRVQGNDEANRDIGPLVDQSIVANDGKSVVIPGQKVQVPTDRSVDLNQPRG